MIEISSIECIQIAFNELSSIPEFVFPILPQQFDAIHGGTASFACDLSLLLTSIMNSCAYFRDSNSSGRKNGEHRSSSLYRRTRRWGEYRLLCFAVSPSSTANNSSSNICFSLCDFFLLLLLSMPFQCFMLHFILFAVHRERVRVKAMKDVIYYDFNFPSFCLRAAVEHSASTHKLWIYISWIWKVYFSYLFMHLDPGEWTFF